MRAIILLAVLAILIEISGSINYQYSRNITYLNSQFVYFPGEDSHSDFISNSPPDAEYKIVENGIKGKSEQYGPQKSIPIGSIAKLVTALTVLLKKPLKPGEDGPNITVTKQDVDEYYSDLVSGQSTSVIVAGEKISEYQALESMLVMSSNNIAYTLVNWAFGSQSNYLKYANNFISSHGFNGTHINDASGYSPQTISNPSDLIDLGRLVIISPVLNEITRMKKIDVPYNVGSENTNKDLGIDDITGIKTGNTSQSGGSFLFSAKTNNRTILGVILGEPNLNYALYQAPELIDYFKKPTIINQQ